MIILVDSLVVSIVFMTKEEEIPLWHSPIEKNESIQLEDDSSLITITSLLTRRSFSCEEFEKDEEEEEEEEEPLWMYLNKNGNAK